MIRKNTELATDEDGMLARIFNKILFDTGIVNNIRRYINSYIKRGGKRSKSQINKLILDKRISWKSFTFLIFEVLYVKRMDITIKLHFRNGEVTEHTKEFEAPSSIKEDENFIKNMKNNTKTKDSK